MHAGMHHQGVFRIPGPQNEVNEFRNEFESGTYHHCRLLSYVHIICILLVSVDLHCVSKKVPTFELSVTLSNLNRFSKFLHCWKVYEMCYKFATKRIRHYPSHLRHCYCTTLGNKKSHFLQIFSRYEIKRKQILIFSVFKI